MNKTKINAKIVADSVSPRGNRLTSLSITFPRIILFLLLGRQKFCIFVEKLNHVYLQNNEFTQW